MNIEKNYLTYDEFKSLGGSNIDEMPFKILECEARLNVDLFTFGRLKELSTQVEEVKLCIYKLVLLLDDYNKNNGVSSESIDGYNVQYSKNEQTKKQEIKDIIKTYLTDCKLDDGTPYLYRG
jgi:hypothetical protein